MLLTWHNLTFYQDLMQAMRQAVADGVMTQWARGFTDRQQGADAA